MIRQEAVFDALELLCPTRTLPMPCDSPQQADAEIDCIMLRIDSGVYSISGPELGQRSRFCPAYWLVWPSLLQKNSAVNTGGRGLGSSILNTEKTDGVHCASHT